MVLLALQRRLGQGAGGRVGRVHQAAHQAAGQPGGQGLAGSRGRMAAQLPQPHPRQLTLDLRAPAKEERAAVALILC